MPVELTINRELRIIEASKTTHDIKLFFDVLDMLISNLIPAREREEVLRLHVEFDVMMDFLGAGCDRLERGVTKDLRTHHVDGEARQEQHDTEQEGNLPVNAGKQMSGHDRFSLVAVESSAIRVESRNSHYNGRPKRRIK